MKKYFIILLFFNLLFPNLYCQRSLKMLQQTQQDINSQLKSNKNKIASVINENNSFKDFANSVFGNRRSNNCTSEYVYRINLVSHSKVLESAYYCEDERNLYENDYRKLINYLKGGGDANNGYRQEQIANPNFRRTKSGNVSTYGQGNNHESAPPGNNPDAYALSQLDGTGQIKGSPFDVESPRTNYNLPNQPDDKPSDDNVSLKVENDYANYLKNKEIVSTSEGGVVLDDTHGPLSVKYQNNRVVLPETKLSIESIAPSSNENTDVKVRTEGREEWLKKVDNMSPAALAGQEKNYEHLADMAGLAEYSYKEKQGLPRASGWTDSIKSNLFDLISRANTNEIGFHCELLYNDSTKKYVLSFRGTEPTDVKDWTDDLTGNFIKSAQTKEAIKITKELLDAHIDPKDIQLTGHSLGGRLAAEASIETGLIAYTFNAADISWNTRNNTGINNKGNIINTVSSTDILTNSPVGLGKSGGGINHQSTEKLVSDFSLYPIINPPTVNDYMGGYTNVITEAAGIHGISPLRDAIEQRHEDIVNKIKSLQLDNSK